MTFNVHADMARRLTIEERQAVFAALDELVPDSGCVDGSRNPGDEVHFRLQAPSIEKAQTLAADHVKAVLARAGVDCEWTVTLT